MPEQTLQSMASRELDNLANQRIDLADDVLKVPTSHYHDADRWRLEVERVFKRLPLALAFSSELAQVGDYKALKVVDVPVLVVRQSDGGIAAFVNMCSHRGNYVAAEGRGQAKSFRCEYHAWNYGLNGDLINVFDEENFGHIDKANNGLTPLPVSERAGMIWVTLDPNSVLDIDLFLSGYGDMLDNLCFAETQVGGEQHLSGPNWKVAYDGYRDFYHVPILHKDTIGAGLSHQPDYYAWGPHVRVVAPDNFAELTDLPENSWSNERLTMGVWTIFPNISIAGGAHRSGFYMVSRMFPGAAPGQSETTQTFLYFGDESDMDRQALAGFMDLMKTVVADEDYFTGFNVQTALATGAKEYSYFGRNEGGGQLFHRWVDAIIAADDDQLPQLFQQGLPA